MMTEAITTAAEYAAGIGLDVAKEHAHDKLDEKKLRTELIDYIERQRKYNEMCAMAEEIDFQGLMEYIQNDLLKQAGVRIFDPNSKRRRQARQEIIDAAVAYSNANTNESKYRVATCISICIDIIRGFYKEHRLSVKDYLLADMVVDAVVEEVHETQTATVAAVDSAKEQILAKLDNTGSLFSVDKALAFVEAGKVDTIGSDIKKLLDHITIEHPYYPHFGYDYRNGMILSKPLTDEAKKLYPPKLILTGAVRFGDRYYNDPNGDPLDYAYRHQLPITMEVSKAIKLLGEKPDPRQDEVAALEGNTVIATPPRFPPAFPCAIKVSDKTFFDYVLLRTQEILDDGTYVIGNIEQGGCFYFEVRINPHNPSKPDFRINMSNATNKELLNYAQFLSILSKEKDLHIYVLDLGEDIIAGHINDINYKTGFVSVDDEIDFLERVCAIEDYFRVVLSPRGEISNKEYEAVVHISNLIRNDEVRGTWSEATFTGIMSQHFRDELITMDKELYMFSYVGISHVKLFGAEFEFRFMRTFKSARMVDFEKVKRKAEVLDDGDNIKITFMAGDDKETIDTLRIPEMVDRAS